MNDLWQLVVLFFMSLAVAYTGAMMPGSMLTVVIAETPRHGARTGPLVVLGHAILELLLLILLVVGLRPILADAEVQSVMQIVGGGMLAVTGVLMIVAVARDKVAIDWNQTGSKSHTRTVVMGAVSSLINPYWAIWWATVGLALLTKAYALGIAGLVVFYVGHILGDLTWYSLVSSLLAAGRRFMTPRVYRVVLAAAACVLFWLAAKLLVDGWQART